jgi:hypothetical protein
VDTSTQATELIPVKGPTEPNPRQHRTIEEKRRIVEATLSEGVGGAGDAGAWGQRQPGLRRAQAVSGGAAGQRAVSESLPGVLLSVVSHCELVVERFDKYDFAPLPLHPLCLLFFQRVRCGSHELLNGDSPAIRVGEQFIDGDVRTSFGDVPRGWLGVFFHMGAWHQCREPLQILMAEIEETNGIRLPVE